jgi:hypothetical protein
MWGYKGIRERVSIPGVSRRATSFVPSFFGREVDDLLRRITCVGFHDRLNFPDSRAGTFHRHRPGGSEAMRRPEKKKRSKSCLALDIISNPGRKSGPEAPRPVFLKTARFSSPKKSRTVLRAYVSQPHELASRVGNGVMTAPAPS